MTRSFLILIFLCFPLLGNVLSAQQLGVKSDVLYWTTATVNLGMEFSLSPRLTLDVSGSYHPWSFDTGDKLRKLQHWLVRPELRFWVYEKFDGHFLGVHPFFGSYNMGGVDLPVVPLSNMKTHRYEGYGTGVGLSYGYQWYLGAHWNLEATLGLGYAYLSYDRSSCYKCTGSPVHAHKHWVGPTKLGLSFIYLFTSKK